jgi:NAD(P)-dependent dehydrogenase (short-subunit alcohol dehydrogenase family)
MKKKALVVGGTSGLGLEIASLLQSKHCDVVITGRKMPPDKRKTLFSALNLANENYLSDINNLLIGIGAVDILVYAAGFYQQGNLRDLPRSGIETMIRVGLTAPTMLLRSLLQYQKKLPVFVAITSTSQWTPRADEPVYCATKAALGMLAESVSLDGSIGQTLTVGVSGMNTPFWKDTNRNTRSMLEPAWVAAQVIDCLEDMYQYRFVKILRNPDRVEVSKERIC